MAEQAGIGPVTCAGCGLLCDDLTVELSGDAVRVTPECDLGARWFTDRVGRSADAPPATIDGEPAEIEAALARAAQLLRGARRPLVYGFDGATVEDARAAVALADRLGALVMTDEVKAPWPGAPALPLRGATTATLGEIRDRSRVVVIWREDPDTTHPRLLERLGFGADPPTHNNRTLVVIDDRGTPTAARATLQLQWPRERDLGAVVTLHALHRKLVPAPTGLDEQLSALLGHIEGAPHVAFVYGAGLTAGEGGQRRALALQELARSLSHQRHVVTLALVPAAGTTGARDALAWQTGYTGNVDLADGHPQLVTATLPTEDVDVALCVEGAGTPALTGVADIALCSGNPATGTGPVPAVSIRTAAAGVETAGTAHRLDGVPLTLQAPLPRDAPTAAALLTRLLSEVGR